MRRLSNTVRYMDKDRLAGLMHRKHLLKFNRKKKIKLKENDETMIFFFNVLKLFHFYLLQ
jgi:hypothetical protein